MGDDGGESLFSPDAVVPTRMIGVYACHLPLHHKSQLLSTSSTAASLQPMQSVPSGSAQQVAISWSCHNIVAPISAVGRLLLQARRPGTRSQTISVIRCLAKTLLGDY